MFHPNITDFGCLKFTDDDNEQSDHNDSYHYTVLEIIIKKKKNNIIMINVNDKTFKSIFINIHFNIKILDNQADEFREYFE